MIFLGNSYVRKSTNEMFKDDALTPEQQMEKLVQMYAKKKEEEGEDEGDNSNDGESESGSEEDYSEEDESEDSD